MTKTEQTSEIETAVRLTTRLGASEAEAKARFFATWYASAPKSLARGSNDRRSFWLGVAESIADAAR